MGPVLLDMLSVIIIIMIVIIMYGGHDHDPESLTKAITMLSENQNRKYETEITKHKILNRKGALYSTEC